MGIVLWAIAGIIVIGLLINAFQDLLAIMTVPTDFPAAQFRALRCIAGFIAITAVISIANALALFIH